MSGLTGLGRTVVVFGGTKVFNAAATCVRIAASGTVQVAGWYEQQVFDLFGIRIDEGEHPPRALSTGGSARDDAEPKDHGLNAMMGGLLDRSVAQTTAASRRELFAKLIEQLVPDEARMVRALSDDSTAPLIHVHARSRGRQSSAPDMENMSLIGRTANLALPHLTPNYVAHLLALGIIETGPEDPEMAAEYEILAADMAVLAAIKRASHGPVGARVERQTIRLSQLGRELWAAVVEDAR